MVRLINYLCLHLMGFIPFIATEEFNYKDADLEQFHSLLRKESALCRLE